MSSGYCGCHANIITIDTMRQILPKEMDAFENVLEEEDLDMGDFFFEASRGETDFNPDTIGKAWTKLTKAFATLSRVGKKHLDLSPGHHSSTEEGDVYDDVDGGFFIVGGWHTLSQPALKLIKAVKGKTIGIDELVEEAFWVEYG